MRRFPPCPSDVIPIEGLDGLHCLLCRSANAEAVSDRTHVESWRLREIMAAKTILKQVQEYAQSVLALAPMSHPADCRGNTNLETCRRNSAGAPAATASTTRRRQSTDNAFMRSEPPKSANA